jgi:uncharacterized protein (TIGR03437 family)
LGQPLVVEASSLPPGASFHAGEFQWTPSASQAGRWNVEFSASDEAGRSTRAHVAIQAGSGGPEIESVQNAASGSSEAACSSGSLATIRGEWLAAAAASRPAGDALSLAGTKVRANGRYVPVVSASPAEVTFVCPASAAGGELGVAVETSMGVSAPATAAVRDSAPGIFTVAANGAGGKGPAPGQAIAAIFNGSRLAMPRNAQYPSQPAQAGDALSILMTGLGTDADPQTLAVRIGDVETPAAFIRPVAGAAGVVEVGIVIPRSAPVGDSVPLAVRHMLPSGGSRFSQTAAIAIEALR